MWRDYCDAQAGFWLNSKFWSKFSRPKFTPEYPPPILENLGFGMTKVYSRLPLPHFRKLQIWDDQSLLRNTPPHFGKLQIWDDQSLLRNTPHFGKLQIWDDQSLLWITPPFRKTSDLGWPKFTPDYPPPISENFRFGMTKVYSRRKEPLYLFIQALFLEQTPVLGIYL